MKLNEHTLAKDGAGVVLAKLLEYEHPKIITKTTRTMHEFKIFLNEINIITNTNVKKQLGQMIFLKHKEILYRMKVLNKATQTQALCHLQTIWRNWLRSNNFNKG